MGVTSRPHRDLCAWYREVSRHGVAERSHRGRRPSHRAPPSRAWSGAPRGTGTPPASRRFSARSIRVRATKCGAGVPDPCPRLLPLAMVPERPGEQHPLRRRHRTGGFSTDGPGTRLGHRARNVALPRRDEDPLAPHDALSHGVVLHDAPAGERRPAGRDPLAAASVPAAGGRADGDGCVAVLNSA